LKAATRLWGSLFHPYFYPNTDSLGELVFHSAKNGTLGDLIMRNSANRFLNGGAGGIAFKSRKYTGKEKGSIRISRKCFGKAEK